MKNLTTILAALLFATSATSATSATFASINIDVDKKQNRIEIQSTDSKIHDVTLNKVDGGLYETNISNPSDILTISTKNLQQGIYLLQAMDLNGNKESQFVNVN